MDSIKGHECLSLQGTKINIYEQPQRFNRGAGDIVNLWSVGIDSTNGNLRGNKVRNAIKPNSPNRWIRKLLAFVILIPWTMDPLCIYESIWISGYVNPKGQYVIPYIVGGSFGRGNCHLPNLLQKETEHTDDGEHTTISKAMMAIAQNTCIKFQKRGGESLVESQLPTCSHLGEADFVS